MDCKNETYKKLDNLQKTSTEQDKLKLFEELLLFLRAVLFDEEQEHSKVNLPDKDVHRAVHAEFLLSLFSFKDQFFTNSHITKENVSKTCQYVCDWIIVHEKEHDSFADSYKRISEFIA